MKFSKMKIKTVEIGHPADLLAAQLTLTSKSSEIEETGDGIPGIIAFSKKTGRYIKIPGGNIKAIEYFPPELKEGK